jgi:outer membrane protein OmpA-like peptidoglycan-associated protein
MADQTRLFSKGPETKRESRAANRQRTGFSRPHAPAINQVLFLQRTIGNQAVQRLFKSGVIQPKLRIGQPNDIYEQEADRVADEVMRMPEPTIQPKPSCLFSNNSSCGDEELIQKKPLASRITPLVQRQPIEEEEEETLQTKKVSNQSPPVSPDLETNIQSSRTGGTPLPESVRAFFEPRFGQDFSQVRMHTDTDAAQMNRDLNARAFTYGKNVYFGAGEFNPGTSTGNRLLAHELTHVIQQRQSNVSVLRRRMEVENPNDPIPGTPVRQKWQDIRDYIRELSTSFDVNSSYNVVPTSTGYCIFAHSRFTDRCLCDLHNSSNVWKIKIDDNDWPHTEDAPDRRVTVHSSRSGVEFGAWGGGSAAGSRIMLTNARVLGHELCGHAWLMELTIHPPYLPHVVGGRLMGRPSHDITVMIENLVAQEVYGPGFQQRGTFSDPHHGESLALVTISEYPTGKWRVADLSSTQKARVDRVKDFMLRTTGMKADIFGHADHTGSASANNYISRMRARDVRRYLIANGIASRRFLVVRGSSNTECPPAPVVNPNCRKVQVYMFGYEGASERYP